MTTEIGKKQQVVNKIKQVTIYTTSLQCPHTHSFKYKKSESIQWHFSILSNFMKYPLPPKFSFQFLPG